MLQSLPELQVAPVVPRPHWLLTQELLVQSLLAAQTPPAPLGTHWLEWQTLLPHCELLEQPARQLWLAGLQY